VSNKITINSIQSLRGIAATFVIFAHAQVYLSARNYIGELNPLIDAGRSGVDLFFVISGFIMIYVANTNFEKKGASVDFMIRRIIRVVPIYWFYTLCLAFLLIMFPQQFSQGKVFELEHLLTSLFFIPHENSIGYVKPTLMVGWTLNYEMYFYLVFSFLLLFSRKYFLILLSTILLGGIALGWVLKSTEPLVSVITSPHLIEFLAGSIIGLFFLNKKINNFQSINQSINQSIMPVLLIVIGITLFIVTLYMPEENISRVIKWGGSSALIVSGLVFLEKKGATLKWFNNKWLNNVGNASYSIYLSHIFIINLIGKVWTTFINGYFSLFVITSVIVSLSAGYTLYFILERPITNYLNNFYWQYKEKLLSE